MRVPVIAIASLGLVGCFYVDPINQRPSLDIRQESVGDIFRDEEVTFTAVVVDPDDNDVDVTWRAYMCTDATTFSSCDTTAMIEGSDRVFKFTVPKTRIDMVTPVAGLRLVLDGIDDHGATAKPTDQLQLAVKDRGPDLDLSKASIYVQDGPKFVVGTPIDFYALYGDGDNNLDDLDVEWTVFSPMQVPINLVDGPVEMKGEKRQMTKTLTPQIPNTWSVKVTVTDPGGNSASKMETLNVVDDGAPCIDTVAPIVPPPATPLLVEDTTVFQVPIVLDDLDSYPRTAGGALFGDTRFVWTLLGPTGGRLVVGSGSNYVFDPDTFAPGSIVEVRVEIQDRKLTPVNCADSEATCSTSANACIQRQTWKVEAR